MENNNVFDIIILGAGLTGLTVAYRLKNSGQRILILEARPRIGGRIHTLGVAENNPIELGATWLGTKHKTLIQFLQHLKLDVFNQNFGERAFFEPLSTNPPYLASLPSSQDPSFRIKGGSAQLINKLASEIGGDKIKLNDCVESIDFIDGIHSIQTSQRTYKAKQVVSTLPPNLLYSSVKFTPQLPEMISKVVTATHTWMGESIKIALSFNKPFWQKESSSGTVLSNVGPIPEMYEHNNFENNFYALKGFFNGSYYAIETEQRKQMVLRQLQKYYGPAIENYSSYHEKVWALDRHTYAPYNTHVIPHQNNGHQIFQTALFNETFYIAGSETSPIFPGYMEGAVYSGLTTADKLLK